MAVIAIPSILKEKFGEATTDALIDLFNQVEERAKDRSIEVVEERFERRLAEEAGMLKVEIANTKAELRTDIANTKAELRTDIANTRANLIKWMFIFWVGQVGTITAILFAFFRK